MVVLLPGSPYTVVYSWCSFKERITVNIEGAIQAFIFTSNATWTLWKTIKISSYLWQSSGAQNHNEIGSSLEEMTVYIKCSHLKWKAPTYSHLPENARNFPSMAHYKF